ncbi:DUF3352 domain-containing protein [Winogradskyella flava]|uniref:Ribonuclease HII n=1 Tax=Winogradskyella flava TaxID=1884876 RepID=A0A842ITX3_9FLAO|nr:DUF3352 domain-containing protein [Winogradskyella flava]MBC2846500.1 ribonuclease HII [Winogradskyella flava]
MKRLFFFLVLLSAIVSCHRDYNKIKSPNEFLPTEVNSVILVNELNDFTKNIEKHDILSDIYIKELRTTSKILENLNTTRQIAIAFLNQDYLILTENDSTLFILDSIENHMSENIDKSKISKTQIDSTIFYHKVLNNVFAASNNLELLNTLSSETRNQKLKELIETTDSTSVASLIFKTNSVSYSKFLFSEVEENSRRNYTVLDLTYSDDNVQYNGLTTSNDSILNKIDVFKNTVAQKINVPKIAPYNIGSLKSITYDDFSVFNKNLSILNNVALDSTQTFLNFTNEIALTDDAIFIHSFDTDLILESIDDKSSVETYREIEIYEFGRPDFFQNKLRPFIEFESVGYFFAYNEFVVFSNSPEILRSVISSILSNNTLANSDAYKNIIENLSEQASFFIFKNSAELSKILQKDLKGYNANAVEFVYEDNYAHVNGIIQKFKRRRASNSVTESFTTSIKADLISAPQTVKNHITNAHDIALQDANNVLHLISSSGSVLWQKQLQGNILGKIEQIDMYKNGRLQLAFATPNRLYVLDRNGNDVAPFPLKFNDQITQPLSVFDYDKQKNYRLLITQGTSLLMYDARGKSISGFSYKSNDSKISTQPKHLRIGSKDYIAFTTGDNLKILNRQGNTRINVKDKIRFSDNELFLYQNKFTSTNTLGQLVQVDTKGKVSTKNLNLSDKHHLETTSKTLVSLTENKLQIKSRTVDLDYGDYTAPRIFYLNNKIYVTTTDLQSKKVYLFDSQAKPIPNFPVFGTSAAELQELDKDNSLELITQADNKTIVVYEIH